MGMSEYNQVIKEGYEEKKYGQRVYRKLPADERHMEDCQRIHLGAFALKSTVF